MKFYKKYIKIAASSCFKSVYYNDGVNEELYCGQYTKSWSNEEIKSDVLKELRNRFS